MNSKDVDNYLAKKLHVTELLKTGKYSDCVFIVEGKEVKAHKLILACSSEVFERMFYGDLASDRIIITDITLEDFNSMLQFVYTCSVDISSVAQAWSLFYIADKYLLSDFADVCTIYIGKNLSISNLILCYEYAEMYGIIDLQDKCMYDLIDYFRGVFFSYHKYHMKASTLLNILKNTSLNYNNINHTELAIGIIQWAIDDYHLSTNNNPKVPSVINYINSLEILPYVIRLKFTLENVTTDEFVLECLSTLENLKCTIPTSHQFSKKHWCSFCQTRQIYKIAGRIELRQSDELVSIIFVNRDSILYGLIIMTENQPLGVDKNEYQGSVTIKINEINQSSTVVTYCSQLFPYETPMYIPLSNLILLEKDKSYSIKVGYENFNSSNNCSLSVRTSSVLRNYMSNKMIDAKKKIVIQFVELSGSVIKGVCCYPA